MGRENKFVGRIGEKFAIEFLKKRGYKIMATNSRTPFGEIDAVAKQDGLIVFLEIKTRTTSSLGPPYLSVTGAKQNHLIKNALFFLKKRRLVNSNWRIDVVSVKLSLEYELEDIEIIENAVEDNNGRWI